MGERTVETDDYKTMLLDIFNIPTIIDLVESNKIHESIFRVSKLHSFLLYLADRGVPSDVLIELDKMIRYAADDVQLRRLQ